MPGVDQQAFIDRGREQCRAFQVLPHLLGAPKDCAHEINLLYCISGGTTHQVLEGVQQMTTPEVSFPEGISTPA